MPSNAQKDGYNIRLLEAHDYSNGFIECLSELTVVGEISEIKFIEQYINMTAKSKDYHIYVITDMDN
jgi:glucosamine-phosphate N-acetyltransferase